MIHPHAQPAAGDLVGRYRLIAELARGGMGIVYLAAAHGPGGFTKLFALKQLRPDLVDDATFLRMFLDEARVAARLSHPNIVQTNDIEQHDGRYFIAMEYLDGRSLSQVLRRCARGGGFPPVLALLVVRDVLGALDYAHTFRLDGNPAGIVHRDISPQNVFVTFEGCAKVIDFGIAKARDSVVETQTGVLKGKVQYMAPEQVAQRAEPRSDVFSAGAMLYELLAGRRLWSGFSQMEVMARLLRGEVPSVDPGLTDAPSRLVDICRRALASRVEDRFGSAVEMRDALDEYLWSARLMPTCRDVGQVLLREFGDEREATRSAIERRLAEEREGGALRPLRPLGLVEPSERSLPSYFSPVASGIDAPSVPAPAGPIPDRHPALSDSAIRLKPTPLAFLRRPEILLAMPALALVGVLIGLAWRGAPPPPPPPPPPVTSAAPPASTSVPAPTISLAINVSPSTARLSIDGQPLPSNPFLGRYTQDHAVHRIRAIAPGFVAKERVVSFADNVMVDLSLDPRAVPPPSAPPPGRRREPVPRKPAPAAVAPEPPPSPPAPPAVAPATRPADIVRRRPSDTPMRRAIDVSNPYGDD